MKIKLLFILLLISIQVSAQIQDFTYKQNLEKPTEQWHKITLPNEIFSKVESDFSDIRIYGILENKDTIEVPFLIKSEAGTVENKEISFNQINVSNNNKGYYYTFKIPTKTTINEIQLDFNKNNFDWEIQLEGSQNQREWFTVLSNYRIVSIQNQWTDYQFTKLVFSDAKYRYFRLLIKSKLNPKLRRTTISQKEIQTGNYRNYQIQKQIIRKEKEDKKTVISIDLGLPVPVSLLNFEFDNTIDYYRNIQIEYLSDSFKTDNGWRYNYRSLTSDIVTSIEQNNFNFQSTVLQKLKITIQNNDNAALKLKEVTVKGLVYNIVGRFDETAETALYYGNSNGEIPNYDINRFTNKIPNDLTNLKLGTVEVLKKEIVKTDKSLFQNKLWLWGIMLLIILVLGWFSLKMIKGVSS